MCFKIAKYFLIVVLIFNWVIVGNDASFRFMQKVNKNLFSGQSINSNLLWEINLVMGTHRCFDSEAVSKIVHFIS